MPNLFQTRLLPCLLVLSAAQTYALAGEDSSLVESVLDLPGTEEPSPAPPSVPSKSTPSYTSSSNTRSSSLSSSTKTAASLDPSDPENIKTQVPPIHSALPYAERKLLGVKYGKTHNIDTTYRGTPLLPTALPTVTVGNASWAPKRKIAAAPAPVPAPTPVLSPGAAKTLVAPAKTESTPQFSTLNVRFLTIQNFKPTDVVYAYPYPVKPPKPVKLDPLPEAERQLKDMIMNSGYTARMDYSRPYPFGGFRWVRCYETALKKSGTHVPHTMLTVYPWVNKMFPYVLSEVRQMNQLESERNEKYLRTVADYERLNAEMESKAASEGLVPIPVKMTSRGLGHASLPAGSWWLTATRRLPGLKFYWQVPIRCSSGEAINVQFTEANALLVQGGW